MIDMSKCKYMSSEAGKYISRSELEAIFKRDSVSGSDLSPKSDPNSCSDMSGLKVTDVITEISETKNNDSNGVSLCTLNCASPDLVSLKNEDYFFGSANPSNDSNSDSNTGQNEDVEIKKISFDSNEDSSIVKKISFDSCEDTSIISNRLKSGKFNG